MSKVALAYKSKVGTANGPLPGSSAHLTTPTHPGGFVRVEGSLISCIGARGTYHLGPPLPLEHLENAWAVVSGKSWVRIGGRSVVTVGSKTSCGHTVLTGGFVQIN